MSNQSTRRCERSVSGKGNPHEERADTAALMADIRAGVARRAADLRGELEAICREAEWLQLETLAAMAEDQRLANEAFDAMAVPGPRGGRTDPDAPSFAALATVPGAARPWTSPKRWVAALYRIVWRRQETFNREVVRQLAAEREHSDRIAALATRLLGSTNALVREAAMRATAGDAVTAETLARMETLALRVRAAAMAGAPPAAGDLELAAALDTLRQDLRDQAGDGEARAVAMSERLRAAEAAIQRLEAELVRLAAQPVVAAPPATGPVQSATTPAPSQLPPGVGPAPFDFLAFETQTRGSEAAITTEQKRYVELFREAPGPVLDAGCGRGEFLELLRAAGVDAHGVDADAHMVDHCTAKGLDARQGDLFAHLAAQDDTSLGGVFMGQVVEHLPPDVLAALAPLVFRKLRPGGVFVAETINPMCLTTFSGAFYADPTHVKPVHPEALGYFLRAAGFAEPELILAAPVPDTDRLAELREASPLEPHLKDLVLQANANIHRLNELLYSYGNYALAARRPA